MQMELKNDGADEALVQKLINLNTRLTQIATTKNSGPVQQHQQPLLTFSPAANQYDSAAMLPTQTASHTQHSSQTDMKALNTRIASLEEYLQKMGTQLDVEQDENQRLSHILRSRDANGNTAQRTRSQFEADSELQRLSRTITELRRTLNSTQQQLQNERQQYISSMQETENKLRILKTEHGAYKNKLHDNVAREMNANNKINAISRDNEQLKVEILNLRKKIKDCGEIIASNDESNKNLMRNLKAEKYNLIEIIGENEKKVGSLKAEIATLSDENGKLELKLRDRDSLHEKLLKNKKHYEDALGELLSAKKEQSELEKALKHRMFTLNRADAQIKALNEQKAHLSRQLSALRTKYQSEMKALLRKNEQEMKKIRTTLNYQQIKYDDMKGKHESLRDSLLSKARVCENLKGRIDQQRASFQRNLDELISEHTSQLQSISNDTDEIKQVLALVQDFSSGASAKGVEPIINKDAGGAHARIRDESLLGGSGHAGSAEPIDLMSDFVMPAPTDRTHPNSPLSKDELAALGLGIWDPHSC